MKRVLFIMMSMRVGGTAKSLLALLNVLPSGLYEVHLALLHANGGFLDRVPQNVVIHELSRKSLKEVFVEKIRSFHWLDAFIVFCTWIHSKLTHKFWPAYYKYRLQSNDLGHFDLAISYEGISSDCICYLCHVVKATKRCLWVHQDVTIPENRNRFKMVERLHRCLDVIFVVSEEGKHRFDSVYPYMKNKTDVFHNIIPIDTVLQKSEVGDSYEDGFTGKRLLTVGRMSSEKGLLLAIQALKILLGKGLDVKWYFIGGPIGNDYYKQCQELILKEGIEDWFIFLGEQMNPYVFMKDCDVYVQPSLYEAYCTTVMEALCFGNPIVTTSFCGAQEQMRGRKNGYITETTVDSLVDGIIKALNDKTISDPMVQRDTELDKLFCLLH